MKNLNIFLCFALLALPACERVGKDEWSDIDYARIARDNYMRQNDTYYTPPTVLGCTDDDLYNCPQSGSSWY